MKRRRSRAIRARPFVTEKSIASVARRFGVDLRGIITVGMTGSSSILAAVRHLVKSAVADSYAEGLKQGGVSFDEMDSDDALMIIELGENQLAYVTDFVKAVREARDDKAAQHDILDNRVPLWVASIEAAGEYGLASAKRNEMVTWHLGSTREHCKDCRRLNGQKHRRKWFAERNYFPQMPGAAMECGGYNCLCELRT